MSTYVISFELTLPEKKYKSFYTALEKIGAVKVLPNTFFAKTDLMIEEMRISLLPYLQKADGLIIASIHGETAIRNARCSPETLKDMLVRDAQ